jgi:formylglycine-generating enzyme
MSSVRKTQCPRSNSGRSVVRPSRSLVLLSLLLLAPTACEYIAGTKNRKASTAVTSGHDGGVDSARLEANDAAVSTGGNLGTDGPWSPADRPSSSPDTSTGGILGGGGAAGTGGIVGTGGAAGVDGGVDAPSSTLVGSGGTAGRGGASAGGTTGSAGSSVGGLSALGGASGSGGTLATGGGTWTGGTLVVGGSSGAGGASSTGGTTQRDGGASAMDAGNVPACGNGAIETGEACDDGNLTPSDGCSDSCTVESGWTCSGNPSVCSPNHPSCAGLPKICGSAHNADCCGSIKVPGIALSSTPPFYRSYDGVTYTDKSAPATLSDFRLDTYEITVGRFRNFLAAYSPTMTAKGAGKNPNNPSDKGWDKGWDASMDADAKALTDALKCHSSYQTWTDSPSNVEGENRAIACLDWYTAQAFCIWDGGRLPTELEWNYAAAGGTEQRVYPWSNPPTDITTDDTYAVYLANGPLSAQYVAQVGSKSPKGDGKWGHADLAGNVAEWVADGYSSYFTPCLNCAELSVTTFRVQRGGGSNTGPDGLVTSCRDSHPIATNHGALNGARCARSEP